jgi:dolichol-phosphate mannosyltransferase
MGSDIALVIPLKDEAEVIPALRARLTAVLNSLDLAARVMIVDDGSRDATAALIESWCAADARIELIQLTRSFGHQAALCAGLDRAGGRAVVLMDGDLQDPPEVIPQLIDAWRSGSDVVYAIRRRRKEPLPLRLAYAAFYRALRLTSDLTIPLDAGDFCLMDRRVVKALRALPERVRFVRGLRAFVGFRQTGIAYERDHRHAGRSKYRLRSLCRLAADGLFSFSSKPLRLATYLGLAASAAALGLSGWVLFDAFATHTAPRGWASTMAVVLFLGAVQLLCMGILGEYLRLIFLESKGRPTYLVARRVRSRRNLRIDPATIPFSPSHSSASPMHQSRP